VHAGFLLPAITPGGAARLLLFVAFCVHMMHVSPKSWACSSLFHGCTGCIHRQLVGHDTG
jgi:hypothetical protein